MDEEQEDSPVTLEPFRPRRVLVVDDNHDTVQTMAILLREWGHDVQIAMNGWAALEAAIRFRPEIVFLDLALPEMDGFELTRRFRRDPTLKMTRIIAITGSGDEENRHRPYEAGVDDYQVKPVDPKFLESLLGQRVGR